MLGETACGWPRGLPHGLSVEDLHDNYLKIFRKKRRREERGPVKVYNLTQYEHGADDVLVMGTDGLWDVLSNEEVVETVTSFLVNCDPDDLHRYTMAAQDLVMRARGVLRIRAGESAMIDLALGMISLFI
ncbi:hypothetical protein QQF64_035648 [Cirrhinus molitorella]|uniref:PPM-type phosphatase domain-containing protein n=1 Tax=Cirrhinus molitorella TaxID=172907 RepID=A0ABR3NHB1_9TELE